MKKAETRILCDCCGEDITGQVAYTVTITIDTGTALEPEVLKKEEVCDYCVNELRGIIDLDSRLPF